MAAGNLPVNCLTSYGRYLHANSRELAHIASLMQAAVQQAGCVPEVVFVTGGTAKSTVLNKFLQNQFSDTTVVIGDHFGTVTAGLSRWAQRIFR